MFLEHEASVYIIVMDNHITKLRQNSQKSETDLELSQLGDIVDQGEKSTSSSSCSILLTELIQLSPRHSSPPSAQTSPCLRHEHLEVAQSILQLHFTIV